MGGLLAMVFVGIILVGDSNRKLNAKCEQEVQDGIAESIHECRQYYIKEAR
jgi:hypothetical protein